jgi:hypothetical protein
METRLDVGGRKEPTPTMRQMRKVLCSFGGSLLGASALLAAITLASPLIPLERMPGKALAHDRDDDNRDRHDRDQRGHRGDDAFRIEVLSSRPDAVAGGDALVRISVKKKGVRLSDVRVELNGRDVTAAFVADEGANTVTGLVTGMGLGHNVLKVGAEADIVLFPDRTRSLTSARRMSSTFLPIWERSRLRRSSIHAMYRPASTTSTAPTPRRRLSRNGQPGRRRTRQTWQ